MLYKSIEKLEKDFHWLTHDCNIEHFTVSKLSKYDYDKFRKKIPSIKADKEVFELFDSYFEKIGLEELDWTKKLDKTMLPVCAIDPEVGLRIIIEREADGSYRTLDQQGLSHSYKFSKNTLFKPLRFQYLENEKISAVAMFKNVAKSQKKYLFYAVTASVSVNLLALGSSFYSMQVYDRVIPTNGISTLIALTVGVLIAIVLEMILKFSRAAIVDQSAKNMDIEYSHNIFERFLNIRSDNLPKSIGTLSGQLQGYASIRSFISTASMFVFIDFPFSFLFLAVIILLGGWQIGQIVLVFLIVSIFIGMMFKSKIEKLTKTSSMAAHKKLGLLVENVEGAEKIKSTSAKWSMMSKWSQLTEDAIDDEIRIKHYTDISGFLSTFSQQVSYVAIVAMGAYLIATTTDLTMGSLIAITILSNKVFAPIAQLPSLFVQWGRAKIALEDLNNIYSLQRDNEGVDRAISYKFSSYDMRCENIKFEYIENYPILTIPKLEIKQGEKVAILGVIGAGKSTLLKVLSGMYKPKEGKLYLNNIDMQQISRNNLSETTGYLPQETKLFSGTLRDNLSLGLVDVSDEQILDAARKTGLINLVSSLPQGLDTEVPEGGNSVSGGQKQLIAITRMIVASNDILLLDEPTASMDEGTEKHILNVLKNNVKEDQTMVVVTHKPALLSLVDRIIILSPKGIIIDNKKEVVLQTLAQNTLKQKAKAENEQ